MANGTVPESNEGEAYEVLESLLNQYNLPLSLVDTIKEWVALIFQLSK